MPFIIRTDLQSLWHWQDPNLSTELQRKAMTKLAGNQRIPFQYKKGPDNKVAHALSRVGHNLIFLWFPLTYKDKESGYKKLWILMWWMPQHRNGSLSWLLPVLMTKGILWQMISLIWYKKRIWVDACPTHKKNECLSLLCFRRPLWDSGYVPKNL